MSVSIVTAQLTASHYQICACMPALRPFIKRCVAPAFSSVSSRISSLISGSSTTPDNSTVQNSRHSRGHGSYQKFRNNRKTNNANAIDPTSNSSADSSTLKEIGKTKHHPHIAHHHTTSIDADADDDHHHHDHDNHDDHDNDELSFLPHQHARDIAYNVTPRLPPPPPRSPLQITYRQSFELVSLDRRQERRDGFTSPRSPRRQRQGRQEQEQEEQLELDPRGRLEGSAAFGCQTRVSSRHGVSGDEGEGEGEERYDDDDVEGGRRRRRRSGFLGLPGLGVGRGWGRRH